jgi:hypothetical protein
VSDFPDVLKDTQYWLKNHPTLVPINGQRVFFKIPPKPSGSPFLRIYRSGGAVGEDTEIPNQDIRIAVEVWGLMASDYDKVRGTVTAVETLCHEVRSPTLLNPTGLTILNNALVTTAADSPDPDTGWPRYVMDVILTVHPLR